MEPVLGGRDDWHGAIAASLLDGAAMEPVLGGRDDPLVHPPRPHAN